ncbi:MAG: pyruvate ferredoxin oxidoreductase delta subunit [Methanothermococcus sp.]|jgi:pyruvate ferredoxin oxidoreductase delta subunit|uniref:Pyruvate ferredoxin/flavodoxin oxidoreductase delta subunit n=2 Tax=Methanococcus TaxID=2184 RepID=A0A2Z5PFX6_METMI|nr:MULTISPECIES: 4Fe-4S binding protein [Methanococcaceae]ABR56049.1 pyruvate ferredoxin/flavodoxin oxidoreductase, delta subunit [Methanococcus aeolicus Nankai-3]MDK2790574.1 pyruvate ferredoxin oxidoreductase delta subunit [Methanothermococcus sp.]MDK2988040.1 pyruvate ferredoxin oxidoreductase delta subunit [Methanothermococcus sp.]BAP61233.1 pyruvate ferredoxin/flavodoxin oxidoreductase delta subunit [Methanococcus maripaludis KA1]
MTLDYNNIIIGGVLPPGTSVENKTGGWRTYKPIIDYENCNSCLFCWLYCPDGVVIVEDDKITIDYDFCKGCGICEVECPKNAIKMIEED